MIRVTGPDSAVICNLISIHTHIYTYTPWEDQCEWHSMTRMTGLDCAIMNYLINTHTHTHTHTHTIWRIATKLEGKHKVPRA